MPNFEIIRLNARKLAGQTTDKEIKRLADLIARLATACEESHEPAPAKNGELDAALVAANRRPVGRE